MLLLNIRDFFIRIYEFYIEAGYIETINDIINTRVDKCFQCWKATDEYIVSIWSYLLLTDSLKTSGIEQWLQCFEVIMYMLHKSFMETIINIRRDVQKSTNIV